MSPRNVHSMLSCSSHTTEGVNEAQPSGSMIESILITTPIVVAPPKKFATAMCMEDARDKQRKDLTGCIKSLGASLDTLFNGNGFQAIEDPSYQQLAEVSNKTPAAYTDGVHVKLHVTLEVRDDAGKRTHLNED